LEVIHAATSIFNARNEFLSAAASAILIIEHIFVAIFWLHKFGFWLILRIGKKSRRLRDIDVILQVAAEHVVPNLNLAREGAVKVRPEAALSSHVEISENWFLLAARVLGLFLNCLFHNC
jgi:hypothetical protein